MKQLKIVGVFLLKLFTAFLIYSIILINIFRWLNPHVTAYQNIKSATYALPPFYKYEIRHKWVRLKNISPKLIKAILISEDQKFFVHFGFDLKQIEKAINDYNAGKNLRGASTVTQQLARNMFLSPSKNFVRKAFESFYTVILETFLSKERILEIYLNVIELGKNIYGVEYAAQFYFRKSALNLNDSESAMLAAILPNPLRRNPLHPSKFLLERRNEILNFMGKWKIPRE